MDGGFRSWLDSKIYPLLFNHQRPLPNLCVDAADVLANNADEEELHGGEKEEANDHGGDAYLEFVPKHELINEVA